MMRFNVLASVALLIPCFLASAAAETPVAYRANSSYHSVKDAPAPAAPKASGDCYSGCCSSCGWCDCPIVWLRPWKCEDLEMKAVEKKDSYCCGCGPCGWLHSLLWCPPEEEKKEEEKKENGNGEKKNGKNGKDEKKNAKNGKDEKKNGNGEKKNGDEEEKKEEEAETLTPLMQAIQCYAPNCYAKLECEKAKVYGWIQQGITINGSDPDNHNNFGVNFNNRANEYMLNQFWLRLENTLEHEKEFNWGYTIDLNAGMDAPDFSAISLGMWDNINGDSDTGVADDEHYGIDLPQFFVECHIPCFITEKGMDVRVGRFLTLHGNELSPAIQTSFYSHSYGYFYSWPLTHTGVMTVLHLTDTVDLYNGIVVGWDNVFADNNDMPSLHGQVLWTSCDKRSLFWVAYTVGPEGVARADSANDDYRFLVTYDYSHKFGCYDEWQLYLHGANAWDTNLTNGEKVEWYDYAANLFYTVKPNLILGARAEWFCDDDGYRTGFADDFYELTAGFTYKPYQNLRVRPELRFDWADETRPYNDGEDNFQTTLAIDVIWEF